MKILITESEGYSKDAIDKYKSIGDVYYGEGCKDKIESILPEVQVLVVKLEFVITSNMLSKANNLKYIITSTTGLNHINLPPNSDVEILSLKGETDFLNTITPTAELTWGLILNLKRNIVPAVKGVMGYEWCRNNYIGSELFGQTIGIVGYGRLGRMVSRFAVAFGMKVLVCDINTIDNIEQGVQAVNLQFLLEQSDVISVHIPYDEINYNFLDANKLKLIKRGAIFINTSRGEILDENFLLSLLEENYLGGVGLDVLTDEVSNNNDWVKYNKLINSPLLGSKLIITPHIGGACKNSMERTELFMANKFVGICEKDIV